MFATLLGGLPRPPIEAGAEPAEVVRAALEAQVVAGLEPLVDGGGWPATMDPVERWRATSALVDRPVKQALLGPYSAASVGRTGDGTAALDRLVFEEAERVGEVVRALAAAGCPLVEVHEPAAVTIGRDAAARRRFAEAQRRALAGAGGTHCSLAVVGGAADAAGVETLLAAPYASLALDLIAGPGNWRLAAAAPPPIGIVCGALTAAPRGDESREVLLYALGYAASTMGRGPARVGLATAGSLEALPWDAAVRRMRRLGEAVELARASPDERAAALDPRAIDIRSAALGRHAPRRRDR